jgi:hypothetical protein
MKSSSCAALTSFTFALSVVSVSYAQDNQESHGGPGATPPPTYYAPPPGGGYAPNYQPAPPPPYGPKKMKYNEGDPVPPGYRVEERARTGLVVGGACLFGITYLLTALVGSVASDLGDKDSKWLLLPVAGPFVYSTTYSCDSCATGKTFLYIDGLAQGGGVLMFVLGLAGQKMLIRNDVAKVQIVPTMGKTNGLSLVGTF